MLGSKATTAPLRVRLVDLALICADILERISADAGIQPPPRISNEALEYLATLAFPGNVRELENLLHRALALSGVDLIGTQELSNPDGPAASVVPGSLPGPAWTAQGGASLGKAAAPAQVPAHQPGEAAPALPLPPLPPGLPADLASYLDAVERFILERALVNHRFNRTAAAASLGLSLRQMRYRMARLGIGTDDGQEAD